MDVLSLFEEQVNLYPDQIAVSYGADLMTYVELDARAQMLCNAIHAHSASGPVIGISATRGLDTIIGILGILKAGKACLPLDPMLPNARLEAMIADAGVEVCLAPDRELPLFQALGLAALSYDTIIIPSRQGEVQRQELSYVLYTSGSTGKPKGVAMPGKALVNLVTWQAKNSVAGKGDRTLQFAPLTFDVAFQEVFATLGTGGELVILPEDLLLEPGQLIRFIADHNINRVFLPFVALQNMAEAAVHREVFPAQLYEVIVAGEQMKITPQVIRFFQNVPAILYNQYGPTECHVVTSLKLIGDASAWPLLPSIGRPIDNVSLYIVDDAGNLLEKGNTGELYIAGDCLAWGYINNARLTAEKFKLWQHPELGSIRVYTTGDAGYQLPDGNIQFVGRKDDQLKISGYRIEPAEIEAVLNNVAGVKQAVVAPFESSRGVVKLGAWLVSSTGYEHSHELRKALELAVPYYMIPATFTWLKELPLTASGKVNRKALPHPEKQRPATMPPPRLPITEQERRIADCWSSLLDIEEIGVNDNFFELGGTSLLAVQMVTELHVHAGYTIPVARFYRQPTIAGITAILNNVPSREPHKITKAAGKPKRTGRKEIAIVSMAGRFPGAATLEQFWEVLAAGQETISFFGRRDLDLSIPETVLMNPDYVPAKGILDDIDKFDPEFFGINPKLAALMDPQQRLFLELAWEALEKAGYLKNNFEGNIGVFAGTGNNSYYHNNVLTNRDAVEQAGAFQVMTYNEKDYIATRTSYIFNLKGPAISVHSACSTSALAIAQAVDCLRNGHCDMAIAGAASITVPVNSGYLYHEGGILSKDGHCRPFDAEANGTVFSDGGGILLLKPLEHAERDGDTIYAVITGIGINNDGSDKGFFSAPSPDGQAGAILMAMDDAGITADDLQYIEAHGTATLIGDPIEIEGLKTAFADREREGQYCAVSSLKGNFGHLTAAAGVAGVMKTALQLQHGKIAPTANFEKPGPLINFTETPFFVSQKLTDWPTEITRRAGVSSFGVGGTNVHIILEEYPQEHRLGSVFRPYYVFCWSAKTAQSREAYAGALAGFLKHHHDVDISDIAWTLHARRGFQHRRYIVAETREELEHELKKYPVNPPDTHKLETEGDGVVFMFPGQGAQYTNMALALYRYEPVFKNAVDECAALLLEDLEEDIRDILYPPVATEYSELKMNNTKYTQPAVFVVSYATARLWMSWGIKPAAVTGHSIGEFVAAHFAGILSLRDALHLVAQRGIMMAALPEGGMIAVRAAEASVSEWLQPGISIAAINSASTTVVSGPKQLIEQFDGTMQEKGVATRKILASHAFHSDMMEPVTATFTTLVSMVTLSAPKLPMISTVTGKRLTDEQALDVNYWAQNIRSVVRFADAADLLAVEYSNHIMLEAGPGNVLSNLVKQNRHDIPLKSVPSLANNISHSAYRSILAAAGQLWLFGIEPDWNSIYSGGERILHELPTYVFDKKVCWIHPPAHPVLSPSAHVFAEHTGVVNVTETADNTTAMPRLDVTGLVVKLVEGLSGKTLTADDHHTRFLEMGLDSLTLTQLSIALRRELDVTTSIRELTGEAGTLYALVANVTQKLANAVNVPSSPMPLTEAKPEATHVAGFGAGAQIDTSIYKPDTSIQRFIDDLIFRYNTKTAGSKAYTARNRARLADPRVVSGFNAVYKELVYPLVVNRSQGSRVWDVDGNEYIDALNGFGTSLFGHQPDFLNDVLHAQIEGGMELGPQHPLAGEVADLVCELTGHERMTFCTTGSEAVLGAIRIARTVTGRKHIMAFTGAYHGVNDEAIVRATADGTQPAAPGILPDAVKHVLVADYGSDDALNTLKERAFEIAAVIVEPVQSRRPGFFPEKFLRRLRELTAKLGVALIFDEVITGFRVHKAGVQGLMGIKADIATYGKVVANGMPIGVIAGSGKFMDALDGGSWQYGDESAPETGVTYLAGTFVRHPLSLAAAKASLSHIREIEGTLYHQLGRLTELLAGLMNDAAGHLNVPVRVAHFGSVWKLSFLHAVPFGDLLFTLMKERGVHILPGFPCFVTAAHTEADIRAIAGVFADSIADMQAAGFFGVLNKAASPQERVQRDAAMGEHTASMLDEAFPPVAGAKLGINADGNPAWFVADPERPNKYLQLI